MTHSLKTESIMVRKACNGNGKHWHIVSTVRKLRGRNADTVFFPLFVQCRTPAHRIVLSTFRVGLTTSAKHQCKCLDSRVQRVSPRSSSMLYPSQYITVHFHKESLSFRKINARFTNRIVIYQKHVLFGRIASHVYHNLFYSFTGFGHVHCFQSPTMASKIPTKICTQIFT